MSEFNQARRLRVGAGLLALIAVFSCLDSVRLNRWVEKSVDVQESEERVEAIRRDLPSHGMVGYVADDLGPTSDDKRLHAHEFFHIQYALAPLILVDSQHYPLVVGDFHAPIDPKRITELKLVRVRDYGNGVVLFRSATP
jgi:hypothetical protein